MSNEVTFTGRVESVQRDSVVVNDAGEELASVYTVKIGTRPWAGTDVAFEFTTFETDGDPMDAWVSVTVRFPEGWEVQA